MGEAIESRIWEGRGKSPTLSSESAAIISARISSTGLGTATIVSLEVIDGGSKQRRAPK
jgi:hypothetical protein